jgi:hypothetical protein
MKKGNLASMANEVVPQRSTRNQRKRRRSKKGKGLMETGPGAVSRGTLTLIRG